MSTWRRTFSQLRRTSRFNITTKNTSRSKPSRNQLVICTNSTARASRNLKHTPRRASHRNSEQAPTLLKSKPLMENNQSVFSRNITRTPRSSNNSYNTLIISRTTITSLINHHSIPTLSNNSSRRSSNSNNCSMQITRTDSSKTKTTTVLRPTVSSDDPPIERIYLTNQPPIDLSTTYILLPECIYYHHHLPSLLRSNYFASRSLYSCCCNLWFNPL